MKPSSTSAASTAFCAAKIDGPDGFLWIDGNGKITAGNGTLDDPKPNAFSLVQIQDCPGSTPTCRTSCYVHGLEKHAPDTYALYRHNSETIRRILENRSVAQAWSSHLARWITENCRGGFRWHVSGDVFSLEYAKWIVRVCLLSPDVRHWIYTRSFEFVPTLVNASTERAGNLALNLSCDSDNWHQAKKLAQHYGLRLCYLTTDGVVPFEVGAGATDDVIFPDYNLRGGTEAGQAWFAGLAAHQKKIVCPVDFHGKAENRRCGPCDRCLK